jgi:F0F1-type ATP synthase assembly protein I
MNEDKLWVVAGVVSIVALILMMYWFWITSIEMFIYSMIFLIGNIVLMIFAAILAQDKKRHSARIQQKHHCVSPN